MLFSSTFSNVDTSKWIYLTYFYIGKCKQLSEIQLPNKSPLILYKCRHDDTASQNSHEKKINVQTT